MSNKKERGPMPLGNVTIGKMFRPDPPDWALRRRTVSGYIVEGSVWEHYRPGVDPGAMPWDLSVYIVADEKAAEIERLRATVARVEALEPFEASLGVGEGQVVLWDDLRAALDGDASADKDN